MEEYKMTDFARKYLQYSRTLAPEAWAKNRLIPEVRFKLLNAAKHFMSTLNVPGFQLIDVVLTGSMVNYNYTKFSDFDVHLITDFNALECDDIAEELYMAKKSLWNERHDIIVRGHEVEMYIEDVNQPPISGGVYSLLDDKWIKVPSYNPPDINDSALNHKVEDLIKLINNTILHADDADDLDRLSNKLRKYRQTGLDTNGEYSLENLAYKIIRNLGFMDKLYKTYNKELDTALGL